MLEGILFFLMTVLIFVFTPFTGSLMIPTVVRIILLLSLVIFGIVLTIKKKQVFYFLVGVMTVGLAIAVTWLKAAPYLISVVMYFFAFCTFAVTFNVLGNRLPLLKFLIKKLFYCMLMTLAVLAVVSFIAFNLSLVPYSLVNLGGFDFYQFYYNPLLGYINPKLFGDQMLGRVAGFMFEPSYQAWFFTTNFFLVDRMVSKKGMPVVISKTIIFLGAMATLSTAAMLAFAAIFSFQGGIWFLRRLGMKRKMEMAITWFVCLSVPIAFLLLSSGASSEALGDSSLGDRQGRTESSFLIVASSSPVQLLLGHGSGYVELQDNAKGESNQYVKMFVEQGIILMVLIIAFIVNVTRHQRYYMLATLIFLNSVVIMWTPLFWINILLCKWLAPSPEPAILPQSIE